MSTVVRRLALLIAGAALPLLASPAMAECLKGPFKVNLPAQRLDERMQALSRVTGCAMEVDPALLGQREVPRLRGRLTTREVVLRSLRGTGLEAGPDKGHWRIDRAGQERFAQRIANLRTALEQQRSAEAIPAGRARGLGNELDRVWRGVARNVRQRGFIDVPERGAFDARLDRVARRLGVPVPRLPYGWVATA